MKAILVKDNDFKTIGFEVTSNGVRVFNYGIAPQTTTYTKEINVTNYMTDIFELVRVKTRISELNKFMRTFFEIAKENDMLKKDQGIDFKIIKIEIEQNERKLKNIIDNII